MKKEKKRWFSKKKLWAAGNRLVVALVAVGIAAVLILWDTGVIDLPGLVRHERRTESATEEKSSSTTTRAPEPVAAGAAAFLASLYEKDAVASFSDRLSLFPFDSSTMSFVKKPLPETEGSYEYSNGLLLHTKNGVVTSLRLAATNEEIRHDKEFTATRFRDKDGNPVFRDTDGAYLEWSSAEKKLVPSDFVYNRMTALTAFGITEEYLFFDVGDTTMLEEEGLYGYTGKYKERWYTRTFTVEPQYPFAFPYSEGYAVMADKDGRITIRDNTGEPAFTQYSLILPEETGTEEDLGYYGFCGGLLRVIVGNFSEEGTLLSQKQAILSADGTLFSLPEGFRAVSYHDGIFTITDGKKFAFYTCHNAWITNPEYLSVTPFREGLSVVQNEDGLYGVIDLQGKTVIPCAFDKISPCEDGTLLVYEKAAGWHMLSKVDGIFRPGRGEILPNATEPHTKVTVTRGPNNTKNEEDPIIVTLAPITSTPSYTTHPPVDR